jgi:phage terminase large subunit-like protein
VRDYVGIATAYAQEAVADKKGKKFGKWIRLAGKRFLADLKRASRKRPPFLFDEWHACDPCDFIEKLPHVEGKWARPEIELHRSHVFFVVQLFGFRNLDGSRRFTSALFAVARKNAKSTLAAAILLYCQCCEEEEGAQIISAATTGSQARIIFNVAKRMTEKTPDLQEAFGLACWANAISRVETGASFKPINAKASTQDGLNPSHVGLDEIHAHKSADLLNVLTSAAGARSNPLWLYTTTEGYTNPGPWGEIRQFAKQVLQGILGESADHFLVVFFAVDDEDDEFDESAWPKANPLMDAKAAQSAACSTSSIPCCPGPTRTRPRTGSILCEASWLIPSVASPRRRLAHCWLPATVASPWPRQRPPTSTVWPARTSPRPRARSELSSPCGAMTRWLPSSAS